MAKFTLLSKLHRVFYLTCTTHVNFMGSHNVRAILVPDLYYKLACRWLKAQPKHVVIH